MMQSKEVSAAAATTNVAALAVIIDKRAKRNTDFVEGFIVLGISDAVDLVFSM
jgi:hypothetical protein